MAFLCPVRIKRDKKKATNANIERDLPLPGIGMGRITGSSSIETLVRVGIEKEYGLSAHSKMVVLHDFSPCVDDELEVKRGQAVNILYRENDWVYVIGQDTREGFIPYSYCAPFNTSLAELAITKKKLPREQQQQAMGAEPLGETLPLLSVDVPITVDAIDELCSGTAATAATNVAGSANTTAATAAANELSVISMDPECVPFHKEPLGRYIVMFSFVAREENDLSVERGEFVTVLNREDPDWYWTVRIDGEEGFIPAAFMLPAADSIMQTQQKMLNVCAQNKSATNAAGGGGAAATTAAPSASGAGSGAVVTGNSLLQQSLTTAAAAAAAAVAAVNQASGANQLEANGLQPVAQQQQQTSQQQQQLGIGADERYHGTELVMLYDYKGQAPDDLSVRRGDWIYADLNNQTVDGWLWAYLPKTRKYGFIPKAYARPPAMTSL